MPTKWAYAFVCVLIGLVLCWRAYATSAYLTRVVPDNLAQPTLAYPVRCVDTTTTTVAPTTTTAAPTTTTIVTTTTVAPTTTTTLLACGVGHENCEDAAGPCQCGTEPCLATEYCCAVGNTCCGSQGECQLVAGCVPTTTTVVTTTTAAPTTTTTLAGFAATSYASVLVAGWNLDEASGTRDALWGSCGNDCDLTDNNTVTQDAVNYMEGSAAADFDPANNEYLSCDEDPTCNELDISGAITFGCWIRNDTDGQNANIISKYGTITGYGLRRRNGQEDIACFIGDGTDLIVTSSSDNALVVNTFDHAVCVHDGVNTVSIYDNGVYDVQDGGTQGPTAASTIDFNLSSSSTTADWEGQLDECFVDDAAWAATNICFGCSCGLTGNFCMCDGVTPANYKSCTVDNDCRVIGNTTALCNNSLCVGRNSGETYNCASCTLPVCNHSAP